MRHYISVIFAIYCWAKSTKISENLVTYYSKILIFTENTYIVDLNFKIYILLRSDYEVSYYGGDHQVFPEFLFQGPVEFVYARGP